MTYYFFVCRSLTYAQNAQRTLERSNITAFVTRAPQTITIDGCGYCVKVPGRHFIKALETLKNTEIYPKNVFALYDDGSYFEVDI